MAKSPDELIDMARGRSLTEIAVQGVGGWLLAVSLSAITGLQVVMELLFLPFVLFVDVGEAAVQNFFIEPLQLIPAGVEVSAQEIVFFDVLALPASVFIVLLTFGIVIAAISFGPTSNVVPGLVVDNRIWGAIFTTPEEEESDQ